MEQQVVTEWPVIKKTQRQAHKAPKSSEFVETESDDSDNNSEEEDPVVKIIYKLTVKVLKPPRFTDTGSECSGNDDEEKEHAVKKVSKFLGDVETGPEDSGDSKTKDSLRAKGFPIDKSLELGKIEEGLVFKKGIYRGKKISYVATFDNNYLRKMLTSLKTKGAIKHFFKQRH